MRQKFRYFLKSPAGAYYIVAGGAVSTTTTPTPFASDPIEWKETNLSYSRNVKYHGITFKYAAPLSLVLDAARIIRHIALTQNGADSVCTFAAEQLDHTSQLYFPYYDCDIDFSVMTSVSHYVQVELLERGLYAMIKERENTPYEIPIALSDRIPIVNDGIGLEADYVYSTVAKALLGYNSTQLNAFDLIPIDKDGAYSVGEQRAPTYRTMGTPLGPSWGTNSAEHNNYLYRVDPNLTNGVEARLRVYHEIQYTNPSGTGINYYLEVRAYVAPSSAGGSPTLLMPLVYTDAGSPLTPGSPPRRVLINTTTPSFHMNPDDRLYYVFYILGPGASGGANTSDVLIFGQQRIEVLVKFRIPPTLSYGYWYRQLFAKLAAKVTGGLYGSRSDFLNTPSLVSADSKPYYALVQSGDAVRGLGDALKPVVIKTTLLDFYRDAAARWMLGLGVERDSTGSLILRLEHLSYFYQNSVVLASVGLVNNFQWKYDIERFAGQLKIGNKIFSYDNLNGKDEPGTTQVYKLPFSRSSEEIDLVTPYRSDIYGIESVRANLSEKKTTDSGSDNDVFVIDVDDLPSSQTVKSVTALAYTPRRAQNASGGSATGLIDPPKAYNLSLSPKRSLYRNGALLHISLHQQDGRTITWQTSDKNADLQSNLGSGLVVEKANVPVASLAPPLFLPIVFQFDTQVPIDLPALIAANPYGRINFDVLINDRVVTLSGFIDEVGIKPANNEVYTWKLLACPDTDLSALIQ